jgi:hypothetical protein
LKIGIADFSVSRPTVNGLWHRIEKGKVVVESVWANARLRLKHEQKSKSVFGPAIFKKFGEMEWWSMMYCLLTLPGMKTNGFGEGW